MQKETVQYLEKLNIKVKKKRAKLNHLIFVESHPNFDDPESIKRYFELQKKGFNTCKAISEMVQLDFVVADLSHLIYYAKEKWK